ncbi:MAG: hypothetical protein ACT4OE_01980 [Sphingosinicella sp.]
MPRLQISAQRRRDLREVTMIVVGVLIALGLGTVADRIGWQLEVRSARTAVRSEFAFNFAGLDRAERQVGCADRRLEELGRILLDASRGHRLPPLGDIGRPMNYAWQRGVWDSQVAAQTSAHYPSMEAAGIARLHRRFAIQADNEAAQSQTWATLQMLSGPGRPLDSGSEAALWSALAEARAINARIARDIRFTRQILGRALGDDYPRFADARRPLMGPLSLCEPIGRQVPSTYGSPLESTSQAAGRELVRSGPEPPRR